MFLDIPVFLPAICQL